MPDPANVTVMAVIVLPLQVVPLVARTVNTPLSAMPLPGAMVAPPTSVPVPTVIVVQAAARTDEG